MKHDRGFTLIELLVVISIIALLIALLLPALNKSKLSAQEMVCAADMRSLLQASLTYANDDDGRLPDMSVDRETGRMQATVYWSFPSWRDLMESRYGILRQQWYSVTNDKWNRDDFYHWPSGDPDTETDFVMGRFYLAGSFPNSDTFRGAVDPSFGNRGGGRGGGRGGRGDDSASQPVYNPSLPLFHTTTEDVANIELIWTDLNRQLPAGNWITPDDPLRHGANHLYENDWPAGSHSGFLDGHVEWVVGRQIKQRAVTGSAVLFW